MTHIIDVARDYEEERDAMIRHLDGKKKEITEHYDAMIKMAKENKNEIFEIYANEHILMTAHKMSLQSIGQSTEEGENTCEDVLKTMETAQIIIKNAEYLPLTKKHECLEFVEGEGNQFGKLVKREKSIMPEFVLRVKGK